MNTPTSYVYAGSPSVVGSFNVTFFLEPIRSVGATQCIVFKSVPGTVSGVPTSGTWASTTFAGWSGQWIQLGDHVRFFGVTTGGLSTVASANMSSSQILGGVSFNHFLSSTAATSSAGNLIGYRVRSCPTGNLAAQQSDPSLSQ